MSGIQDFLGTPAARVVLWGTLLLIMAVIGWYFLSSLRDRAKGNDTRTDHLANFREMHSSGVLTENEYRTIKTNLGAQYRPAERDPAP